jgi:hypothetical protein
MSLHPDAAGGNRDRRKKRRHATPTADPLLGQPGGSEKAVPYPRDPKNPEQLMFTFMELDTTASVCVKA